MFMKTRFVQTMFIKTGVQHESAGADLRRVGLSFVLYIGIAVWSRAHTTGDFYIAGKGVSPLANGMATAADWMSAASFISMAGLIAFLGYDASVYLMGWTGGYVLLALCSHRTCASSANLPCRSLSPSATTRRPHVSSPSFA